MTEDINHWLEKFQGEFTRIIRSPLTEQGGRLQANLSQYEKPNSFELNETADVARKKLSVYSRQYWFRLLSTIQSCFPLTGRLMGLWHFNQVIQKFLIVSPPRHFDLQNASHGFYVFLRHELSCQQSFPLIRDNKIRDALLKAAEIDQLIEDVLGAEAATPLALNSYEMQEVIDLRFVKSPSFALVKQDREFLQLREILLNDGNEHQVSLPPKLPATQYWALSLIDSKVCYLPLEDWQFRLYELLLSLPLNRALLQLEAECPLELHSYLQEKISHWMSLGKKMCFWIGTELPHSVEG